MNAPLALQETVRQADLTDQLEVQRIEAFVAELSGTAFHRPSWLRAIETGTGQNALGLVTERTGAITGWLPLSDIHSPLFGRALVSSGFGVGGGVLCADEGSVAPLCAAAVELAQRHGATSIELRSELAVEDWQFVEGKHAGFEAGLAGDDEAQLLAIPRKARAEVRKGLKNNLEITTGRSPKDLAAHYACYSESVRNLGTPVFPKSLFAAVIEEFGDDADILTVSHQGMPIASVLSLYHEGSVMPYWGGGGLAARSLRANERMYYELMCHARRRGCVKFDFGRSKLGSGPYSFKKNWGFEPQPLTYRTWAASSQKARNIDPTDEGYSAKIKLWKKLPLPVANLIGPWIARGLG
ncbi:FemAB family XrtA/PEP-CTERM system-associated protein [Qipengyuania psychrotolerans]|uniref:FemAB family PEP-CTERM system-associated protein n=1 Tax=Qipengyuania psychrotolerans TaxID=2867238 RepID=A0ABX8ZJ20_9SPHN|nr:FemAB family XrtA/PEP-CTERM system-associated protein [Qipengyuania psychrotolerans]QZD88159.1 FemAB family PEP-CTERM system-associated protein [Qipengyuania psychrotolerans]